MVTTDLIIIKEVVRLTENYFKKNGILNPLDIVETFEKTMHKELDYVTEARSMNQFRKFYKSETSFKVPKAYRDLSTSKVLVQEFVSGCKITDVDQLKSWDLKPSDIAERGLDVYLKQIFEHGYFHADPHPGNILIKPDGTLYLIDFGMVGKLSQRDKQAFAGVLVGMAQQDSRSIASSLRKLAINSEIDDMRAFQASLDELLEEYVMLDVAEMNMSDLTLSLQRVIYQYKLTIPGGVFLILRALVILEGIGKQIHPTLNTFEFLKPYGVKIMSDQYSPKNIASELYYSSSQFFSLINTLPSELKSILRNIRTGKFHIEVDNIGHQMLSKQMRKASNKLALSFIICGFLVASSVILIATLGSPVLHILGIPVISLFGFVVSLVLTAIVLAQIVRGND